MSEHTDPRTSTVIIPQRLVFCVLSRLPVETASSHFFTIDDVLLYQPFFNDFGPLNLNLSYKFCQILIGKLAAPEHQGKTIYYWAGNRPQYKANAAVLIGIYLVVYGGCTSAQAYEPLKQLEPYMPFRDASQQLCTFHLLPQHCLRAVAKALKLGFFDWTNWNSAEYEYFESVENGDLNIIVPKKFLAFAGPHSTNLSPEGYPTLTPADYVPIFKVYGVETVIRLNKKCYERRDFINAGVAHHDLFHPDGSTPSNAILDSFLQICENAKGTIAVHCKAGLGRTGTTMGCYMMKHYHLSAAEVIAWLRICRPGCVIGPQQHYLKLQEPRMWAAGKKVSGGSSAGSAASAGSASSGLARSRAVSDSNSVHHPSPTPQYALSQPTSPLGALSGSSTPTTPSGHPSYSASFDTPPSLHQQRIVSPSYQSHHAAANLLTPTSSSTYPRTRSVTAAAASSSSPLSATATSSALNALVSRGRSKAPRVGIYSPASSALHSEDAKDASAPLSAPQALRHGSTSKAGRLSTADSKSATISSPSAQRTLFDNKSWLQSNQRRSPSATGLRRGNTLHSPPSSPPSVYASASFSSTLTSNGLSSPSSGKLSVSSAKTRSSSQAPTLGLRQTKPRAKA